jgi:hypothetical protein
MANNGTREQMAAKRALCEKLWAEGTPTLEIARQMGWSTKNPPSNHIAAYRRKGWNLPPRFTTGPKPA